MRSTGEVVTTVSFDALYRICYMSILLAIVLGVAPFIRNALPEYYFVPSLIVTIILFCCTYPLGLTNLANDLRGILGIVFLIELAYLVLQTFDPLVDIYRNVRLAYNYIEFGLLSMLAARLFWFARGNDGRYLSWPPFDFVRPLIGCATSWHLLSRKQVVAGYAVMGGSFIAGTCMMFLGTWFVWPLAASMMALLMIIIGRNDEIVLLDISDEAANKIACLEAKIKRLEEDTDK